MMLVANRLGVDWTHMPQKGGGGILRRSPTRTPTPAS